MAGQCGHGIYPSRGVVVSLAEGIPVVLLDGVFNYGNQPMDWHTITPSEFYRNDPSHHPYFGNAHRKMASWRRLGSCIPVCNPIYLGVGDILDGYHRQPTGHAAELAHSASAVIAYRFVLGTLVGNKTQEVIG